MDRARTVCMLAGLTVALAGLGCRKPNHPPVIISLTASPNPVKACDECSVQVVASDPEGGPLTYHWTASSSNLRDDWLPATVYYVPETAGTYYVKVTVTDTGLWAVSDSLALAVDKDTTTVIDYTYYVYRMGGTSQQVYLREGHEIIGSFSVLSGDISFYVFDSANYAKWCDNDTADSEVAVENAAQSSYSFTVPTVGNYFFTMDNRDDSVAGRDVSLLAQDVTP